MKTPTPTQPRRPACACLSVALLALTSCQMSDPAGNSGGAVPDGIMPGKVDGGGSVRADSSANTARGAVSIPSNAGIDQLVVLALQRNPGLTALRQRAERLSNVPERDRALPDPMVMAATGSMAETAAGRVQAMTSVSQAIPYPGKRSAAAAASTREAEAALSDVAAMELRVEEQIRSAWWDLWLANETRRLKTDSRDLLDALRETVDTMVAADRATQADQLRLTNELASLDQDLIDASRLIGTARARLNNLLHRPHDAPLPAPRPPASMTSATLDSLLQRAAAAHPEVDAAELRRQAYQHRIDRARLDSRPDFSLGVTHAAVSDSGLAPMATGQDQLYATLGFNIPLWREPRRAMIREAEAGWRETDALVSATRADLEYRVAEAHANASAAREIIDVFETRLIPDADQAHELANVGYAAGDTSFTEVIETWQEQLRYQLQHAAARARLAKADAALRAAATPEP